MTRRTFHRTNSTVCKTCDFVPLKGWQQVGTLDPYVQQLKSHLIEIGRWEALEKAVHDAREVHHVQELFDWNITNADDFLSYASHLLTSWIPTETEDGKFIYYVLSLIYFILGMPGLSDLQTPIAPTSISGNMPIMTPISNWVVGYAKRVGRWLSTPESLTPTSYQSLKACPNYCMADDTYQIPDPSSPTGGFTSFNDFFRRRINDFTTRRPIASGNDTVVFPSDSTFDGAYPITQSSLVEIKGVSWPFSALLAGSIYSDRFRYGIWTHAFLNSFNYHRKHAPVAGTVLEAYNVEGCCHLEVSAKQDETGRTHLKLDPHDEESPPAQPNPDTDTDSPNQPPLQTHLDVSNSAGYQFLQTRGVVIIDTASEADIGLVAVIPMGLAIVSSVNLSVTAGQKVAKGDEISWFEFGGSDIVIIFEERAHARDFPELGAPPPQSFPPSNLVGQRYCTVG